eukprot:COSAG05_NODE_6396_length_967_cov_0.927419_1_plen_137_part_10
MLSACPRGSDVRVCVCVCVWLRGYVCVWLCACVTGVAELVGEELVEGAVQAVVPLCAKLECELQRMAEAGTARYEPLQEHRTTTAGPALQLAEGAILSAKDEQTLDVARRFGLLQASSAARVQAEGDEACAGSTGVR